MLRVPFAGGFQVDLQCAEHDPVELFGTGHAVRQWLPGAVGDGYADRILWVSTYRFRQVVADRFTDARRRVLLVGEAAHLFPPFGARADRGAVERSHRRRDLRRDLLQRNPWDISVHHRIVARNTIKSSTVDTWDVR